MCWRMPSMTLGVTVRLHHPKTVGCPLCVRTSPWQVASAEACWSFLEGHFLSYFFPSSKFMTWVFELLTFKLWTLLTKVHIIIDSTFSNSLYSMISRFNLHSNELIDMHLGLTLSQFCMDLPNLGLGPPCYAELFWGQGFPLRISSSSLLSWRTKQCVIGTPWPEVVSHIVFPLKSRARVVVRSYSTLGQSCPFLKTLSQVR